MSQHLTVGVILMSYRMQIRMCFPGGEFAGQRKKQTALNASLKETLILAKRCFVVFRKLGQI